MTEEKSEIRYDRTLDELIRERGILSIEKVVAVILQLVKAVGDLHAQGKVHCQIYQDRVRVDQRMSAKLASARQEVIIGGIDVVSVPCPPQLQNIPPVSLPTEVKTAQEVLTRAGILLDPRQIDFYQLGALLCFMVSGHNVLDYLRSCQAKMDVPEEIRPIIDRALGLNIREQFKSCDSLAFELEAVMSGKPLSKSEESRLPHDIFTEPLPKPTTGLCTLDSASAGDEVSLPFKKLGHYEIIECIGHGGMGDVYKGYEKALDRFVAIKVLPAELARQEDFVKRFHAEATAIAKLDHPNVVRIYYSGEDQGHHFFVTQFVEGYTLAELLAYRKKLSINEALPIIEQCLAGIGAAHKSGLIHRDLKPSNVLLDRQCRKALVTDFGVVKAAQADTQITVTGTVMGTADYIAPEQARGQAVDHRADLYAIGVLIYQMLSGRLPFEAESATSMMFQHAYEPPLLLSEIAPSIPRVLTKIVMKLLSKKPEDRHQSADEVLTDLQNIHLTPTAVTDTSQTKVIEAPDFHIFPELPDDIAKLAPNGWLDNLKCWITDFFGVRAHQVVQRMQTTSQQVDSVVTEYERRRQELVKLAKEAKASTADLEQQAKTHADAAQKAALRAEAALNTTTKHQALTEQQGSEQAAAELAQLAAEQQQQGEDIEMRLRKLDAKLVQLRSRRDVLNARLKAARANLKMRVAAPSMFRAKRRLTYVVCFVGVLCFSVIPIYLLWPHRSPQWISLLELVDPIRNTTDARWKVVDGIAYFESGKPRAYVTIPSIVEGSYKLHVGVTITRAKETTRLILPVGGDKAAIFDLRGDHGNTESPTATITLSGLNPAPEAKTNRTVNIGQEYNFVFTVFVSGKNVTIDVTKDGMSLYSWVGQLSSVVGRSFSAPGTIGLETAYYTTSQFSSLKLRPVSGKGIIRKTEIMPLSDRLVVSNKSTIYFVTAGHLLDVYINGKRVKIDKESGGFNRGDRGAVVKLNYAIKPGDDIMVGCTDGYGKSNFALICYDKNSEYWFSSNTKDWTCFNAEDVSGKEIKEKPKGQTVIKSQYPLLSNLSEFQYRLPSVFIGQCIWGPSPKGKYYFTTTVPPINKLIETLREKIRKKPFEQKENEEKFDIYVTTADHSPLVYINGEPITNNNSYVEILQNHGDRGNVLKLNSIPLKQGDAIFCSGQSGYGKSHIAMAIYKDSKYIWGTNRNCKVTNADNLDFPAPLELMLDGKDLQQAETAKAPYLERISEFKDALPSGDFPGDIIWCPEAESIYMFGIFNIKKN